MFMIFGKNSVQYLSDGTLFKVVSCSSFIRITSVGMSTVHGESTGDNVSLCNQRTRLVKQKSFLKQSLALKSRLLRKSMTLILILTQSQFQTQIEKTEVLTLIQIVKLKILGLGLGLVALNMHRLEMEHNHNLMMNYF